MSNRIENITNQVFSAIYEENTFLLVGESNLLEVLSQDDDGIFPSKRSWISFLNGNFRQYGELYLDGEPKESTIKSWCYDLYEYKDLFVVKVGTDEYVRVSADDLEFTYEYDCNFFNRNENSSYPCMVELTVTAQIK